MNVRENPFVKEYSAVELIETQKVFKDTVNQRKKELRNKYFDYVNGLKVTVSGAGPKTIRLSYNVKGLSSKGTTNCNFYLDWDDDNLQILVPQIYEELGITEDESESPSIDIEALLGGE